MLGLTTPASVPVVTELTGKRWQRSQVQLIGRHVVTERMQVSTEVRHARS